MKKFDTQVQHLKYKVLREVARKAWDDTLYEKLFEFMVKNQAQDVAFIKNVQSLKNVLKSPWAEINQILM